MKRIFSFGGKSTDGSSEMKEILGGKGANLAEMSSLGLPVPPGFTITTKVCREFLANNEAMPDGLMDEVLEAISAVEQTMNRTFGYGDKPLLVSVRSGAPISMPGMMDTVLNLGLNKETVQALASDSGDERFAWDAYRRFITMYADVVLGLSRYGFDRALEEHKERRGYRDDTELSATDWQALCERYLGIVKDQWGKEFPTEPKGQLQEAIAAVFRSWNTPRAAYYRQMNGIDDTMGTAVNVQAMVFGNIGDDCATGVAFTRDPSTGEPIFYGEYLRNAQGEDVVAGIRTPVPINRARHVDEGVETLEESFADAYQELLEVRTKLESHYRDMQDIEFTIERGRLWMLQTRNGKRTAAAAVRIAVDLVDEGLIERDEALRRIRPDEVEQLLHPTLGETDDHRVVARGLPASPGAAVGAIVLNAEDAVRRAERGEAVVLVTTETSPEDIHGMNAARGILTARGGQTSHAAVVARGMGKCAIVGCSDLVVHSDHIILAGERFDLGEVITLNGTKGEVLRGEMPLVLPNLEDEGALGVLMSWVDETKRLGVRANADTPDDARLARKFGAEGIGLCRTEHMFFAPERIRQVRRLIVADDEDERAAALTELLPMQREDFVGILEAMDGLPVTIRLLDPPLHEFLPTTEEEMAAVAKEVGRSIGYLRDRTETLHEFNPMLGHRGCRLGITTPGIYEMQTRAIAEATASLRAKGKNPQPEIMIPLVGLARELVVLRRLVESVLDEVLDSNPEAMPPIGTMIELPRAALTSEEIAKSADFFSFGTNDLTQTTYGLSRDDAGHFLPTYEEMGIIDVDPFVRLDQVGVGRLVEIARDGGRATKPDLKLGICGEHGGEPVSVGWFHRAGLDYVSCSPYRVPVARLAASQAALADE